MGVQDVSLQYQGKSVRTKEALISFLASLGVEEPSRMAEALIEVCGSPSAVLASPRYRLEMAADVSSVAIDALMSARRLALTAFEERASSKPLLAGIENISTYLHLAIAGKELEHVLVLYTDSNMRLIEQEIGAKGARSECSLDKGAILRRALRLDASGIVIAHNHPSGDPTPSWADRCLTRDFELVCSHLSVSFVDHIVVGNAGCYSHRLNMYYSRTSKKRILDPFTPLWSAPEGERVYPFQEAA